MQTCHSLGRHNDSVDQLRKGQRLTQFLGHELRKVASRTRISALSLDKLATASCPEQLQGVLTDAHHLAEADGRFPGR